MNLLKRNLFHPESVQLFDELEQLHDYLLTARLDFYQLALDGTADDLSALHRQYKVETLHFQELGDVRVDLSVKSDDEIGILAKSFQHMVDSISHHSDILKTLSRSSRSPVST